MKPPNAEELGKVDTDSLTPPADRIELLACFLVQVSCVLQNVLVRRGKWDKTEAATELAVVTKLVMDAFPVSFPPAAPGG
jgi:hypothetical protein